MNYQKRARKITCFILVVLLFGCSAGIDLESEKQQMMETDQEFSNMSVEKGTVEAFYF